MGALAARYSPAELAFYLLDFKEGVSFARFAPGRRDPSWLPHVRLVGVNVNTDREFGLALLRFLGAELRRRADAAKRHEVTNLAELRAEDPDGAWPRIVAVVDEFQVLLAGRDAVAAEAVDLLEDLARRGRSQGIHLVLASQDVSGIEALWGRPALVAQFSLRIALPRARRVLAETQHGRRVAAAATTRWSTPTPARPRPTGWSGCRPPATGTRWNELQHRLWRHAAAGRCAAPRLFDGDAIPRLSRQPRLRRVDARPSHGAGAGGAARRDHRRDGPVGADACCAARPGRNLAVLGTRVDEACAVLGTAARSLAAQFAPGTARFSVACLDPDAGAAVEALRAALPGDRLVRRRQRGLAAGGRRGRRRPTAGPRTGRTSCSCTRWTPRAGGSGGDLLRTDPAAGPGTAHPRARLVAGRRPAAATRSAGRRPGPTRSARGWRWTCTAASWRRTTPGTARRPGIRGRGGRCTSTVRCTAAPR